MASRRKTFRQQTNTEEHRHVWASFIKALLGGTVRATRILPEIDERGRLTLDYDDPNG